MEQSNPARDAAIEDAIRRIEWEGAPLSGEEFPTLNPDLAEVEVGSDPDTHPLRKGRIKPDAPEIAETVDQTGQPK